MSPQRSSVLANQACNKCTPRGVTMVPPACAVVLSRESLLELWRRLHLPVLWGGGSASRSTGRRGDVESPSPTAAHPALAAQPSKPGKKEYRLAMLSTTNQQCRKSEVIKTSSSKSSMRPLLPAVQLHSIDTNFRQARYAESAISREPAYRLWKTGGATTDPDRTACHCHQARISWERLHHHCRAQSIHRRHCRAGLAGLEDLLNYMASPEVVRHHLLRRL